MRRKDIIYLFDKPTDCRTAADWVKLLGIGCRVGHYTIAVEARHALAVDSGLEALPHRVIADRPGEGER